MTLLKRNPLPLTLNLLRTNLPRTHQTSQLLPLRNNSNHRASLQLVFLIRQPSTGGRQARRHERRAGQHEADGATVDLDGGERGGIGVDELQVRDGGAVLRLVEEGGCGD